MLALSWQSINEGAEKMNKRKLPLRHSLYKLNKALANKLRDSPAKEKGFPVYQTVREPIALGLDIQLREKLG